MQGLAPVRFHYLRSFIIGKATLPHVPFPQIERRAKRILDASAF
jgi:hypothetical protein